METSGPKDRWKSETDQDEKGETRRRIYLWERVGPQKCVVSGTNVDGSGCRSGEVRNSSMEKYGPPSGERRM